MCGIVGYIGKKDAYPILIKGLRRLEYRGYDSAGVALINANGDLNVYKTKGKVDNLTEYCNDKDVSGCVGIAHTRWATHGEPSSRNAHPHYSESKNLAIIHNGIIENYADLKTKLEAKGVHFISDTDTEVLVQLIEYIKNHKQLDLLTAVQVALYQVIGAYAIAVLDKNDPTQIIAARKQSPLVVGIGEDEFFLGSDASPIVEYTDKVVYLEDGNIAVIRLGQDLHVVNILGEDQELKVKTVDIDLGQIEKGGYPHFMLKEIFEQPECLTNCMRGRVNVEADHVTLSALIDYRRQLLEAKRVVIVACGTSWHAGLIGKQIIETLCRIPVEVEYASEFRYRNRHLQRHWFEHPQSHGHGYVYPRWPGDRRGFDEGVYGSGDGAHDDCPGDGRGEGHGEPSGVSEDREGTQRNTCEDPRGAADERQGGRPRTYIYLRPQFPLSGPWILLSRRPGRCAEAEGDFVYPCRRLSRRRDEARPDSADRFGYARGGDRHAQRDV